MLEGEAIKPWETVPFVLRRAGVEERMLQTLSKLGHLLQLLYQEEHIVRPSGDELLLQVKEVETTTTLLSSIRASTRSASTRAVLREYDGRTRSNPTHRHF